MTIQDDGISFTVQVGSTVLARAFLHSEQNFNSYFYSCPRKEPRARKSTNGNSKGKSKGKTRAKFVRSSSATIPDAVGDDTTIPLSDDDNDAQEDDEEEEEEQAGFDDDDQGPQISEFEISLSALLNCINIFGESSVRPVSARQAASWDKWKARQNVARREGEGEEEEQEADPYEQRQDRRGGSTTNAVNLGNRKKAGITTAMVLSWEAHGCPLVLLCVSKVGPGTRLKA